MESSHTAIIQAKEEQLANYRTAFATAPADKKEFYKSAIKSLKSEISGLQNDARHLADYKTERRQQKLDQLAKKPTLFKERKAKADAKKAKIALAKAGIKAALTADFNAKNEQLKELKQAERPDEAKILEAEQQRNQALAQLESLAEKSFTKAQKRLAPSRLAVAVDSIKEKFEDVRQSIEMSRMRSQYGAHKIKGASKTAHDYRASWE
jgi:chromosome segregation ATPase